MEDCKEVERNDCFREARDLEYFRIPFAAAQSLGSTWSALQYISLPLTDLLGQQPTQRPLLLQNGQTTKLAAHQATRLLPEDPQRLHFYTWGPQQPPLGPPWAPQWGTSKPWETQATSKQCNHFRQGGATATQLSRVLNRSVTAPLWKGKVPPQCKYNSSAPRGILVIGSSGIPQSHTIQQTSHGKEKSQEGGWLQVGEKEQQTEEKADFIGFFLGRDELSRRLGIGGILWPDLGANSGISGILFLGPGLAWSQVKDKMFFPCPLDPIDCLSYHRKLPTRWSENP